MSDLNQLYGNAGSVPSSAPSAVGDGFGNTPVLSSRTSNGLSDRGGEALALPSGQSDHLEKITESIASLPLDQRSPHVRFWIKPGQTQLYMETPQLLDLHIENWPNMHSIVIGAGGMNRFPSITHLTNLTSIELSQGSFRFIPDLSPLSKLQVLFATDGVLEDASSVSSAKALSVLFLYGNRIRTMPDVTQMEYLQDVDLSYNQLSAETIDTFLIQLEQGSKSDYGLLAYSGNPGSPNSMRSAEALVARANLLNRSWTITS